MAFMQHWRCVDCGKLASRPYKSGQRPKRCRDCETLVRYGSHAFKEEMRQMAREFRRQANEFNVGGPSLTAAYVKRLLGLSQATPIPDVLIQAKRTQVRIRRTIAQKENTK